MIHTQDSMWSPIKNYVGKDLHNWQEKYSKKAEDTPKKAEEIWNDPDYVEIFM